MHPIPLARPGQRPAPERAVAIATAVRCVDGEPAKPWWSYPAERRWRLERVPAVRRKAGKMGPGPVASA